MKYFILSNSAVLSFDDKTYTISKNDYRYERIKDHIQKNELEKIKEIINPDNNLNKKGFCVKNGVVFYNEESIPTVLGNKFLEIDQESWQFNSIFNFWYNMKTRLNDEVASSIIQELIRKNAYSVSEDGFYLVYNNKELDQSNSVLNKKNNQEVFNFYNYSDCPLDYYNYFEEKNNIDTIIQNIFGFFSNKLKNIVVQNIFDKKNNFVNYRFLFYGTLFKDLLYNDNILMAIKNNSIDINIGDINDYKKLKIFLQDFSIQKDGKYNQKRINNFLSNAEDKNKLLEIGIFYVAVKDAIKINLQEIDFSNDYERIHKYFHDEFQKIKDPIVELKNDAEIEILNDFEFNSFRILVPKTNYDLKEWSNTMQNCIAGYADQINKKQSQIIAIMDKNTNKMLYNVQISRKKIVQFLGKRNSIPNPTDKKIISEILKENKLIFKE